MNLDFNTKQKPFDTFGSFSSGSITPTSQSGRSPYDPGISAYDIKRRYPDSPNGFYWIKGANGNAIPVWCQMIDNGNGFGWMLIATAQGNGNIAAGYAASSAIHTTAAVGEIDLSTGTIPSAYKISDVDINYWTSRARPQLDHPKLVSTPVFGIACPATVPANKNLWYGEVVEWFIPDTNWTNNNIDFRGKNTGTFSNRGYDTYSQYFLGTPLNNNSFLFGTYTGWGPTLFESTNWGSQIIFGATEGSPGGFYQGGLRTNGFCFYRAG